MMFRIAEKIQTSIREDGYGATARRVARAVPNRFATYRRRVKFQAEFLALESPEDRFTRIHQRKYWQGSDSTSGKGSSLEYTTNLRSQLPQLFARFSIKSVLDAPCGDFNWMKEVVSANAIEYIGGDIVKPLIQQLSRTYSSNRVRFLHLDITQDSLPQVDLMICRDCLIHLSFADTRAVLDNFVSSGIPYLLTTTHTNEGAFQNRDIATGDYRLIDLYSPPYNFPRQPLMSIEDWIPPDPERTMGLWTRDQISAALKS
jgi:SAM-dependent methyltransferase